ncbi:MAG: albumin-binding GA domain-containing protein [Lactobacillus iners]|nr:albumin-binding GA domain-containing protein [Lactobacillus iners]MDK8757010.1 albumin-binding GA domain-containing protein [Lactobacillus iners]
MKKERLDKFSIRKLTVGAASVLIGVAFGATTVSAATGQSTPATSQQTPAVAPQNAPAVVEATNKENNAKFLKQMTDGAIQKLKEKLANATGEEKLSLQAKLADAQKVSDSITALLDRATKNAKAELEVATIKSQLTTATEGDKASLQAKLADAQKSLTDAQKSLTDAEANVTKTQDNIQEAIVAAKLEAAKKDALAKLQADGKLNSDDPDYLSAKEVAAAVKKVEAAKTADEVKVIMADPRKPYSDDVIAAKSALEAAKKSAHETLKKAGITGDIFHKAIDAAKTLEGLKAYVAETLAPYETAEAKKDALAKLQADGKLNPDDPDYLSAEEVAAAVKKVEAAKTADEVKAIMADPKKPYSDDVIAAKSALAAAKKAAHETLKKAGITGKIFHDAIDAAKTVEGLQAYVAETLKAHKTVEPVTPTPAPVVSGETGIGYLNLDMLSDGFTGTLYVPVVGKDVNCKVRLLDDAGKYTNDYVVTDTTVKALASKVVNGVTFYKVAENRWIPAKFAEVLSDKEVAFKGVAKTFVKGHANYAVAMLDADGKYTGKFLKQGSSFKVFAKKVINGHLCYRLGTQAQWVPARFLVF